MTAGVARAREGGTGGRRRGGVQPQHAARGRGTDERGEVGAAQRNDVPAGVSVFSLILDCALGISPVTSLSGVKRAAVSLILECVLGGFCTSTPSYFVVRYRMLQQVLPPLPAGVSLP